ncbi:hypothetical protein Asppvi_009807 [Aspergillus pseudoviridinutans]|uniref:Uncharacterized protein n=1 Tax=Aspergillus pseudoviridinutans TaxID=1517512 RepID=A0A9P3BM33_9EURO|nr:uncharacterized protein Asppvi_009807 [Aspergillus pseudoviridinutans]GIJ90843.1 hypothetical protein Asppvi_009807 [Aspergillus pseudoviridinutans]
MAYYRKNSLRSIQQLFIRILILLFLHPPQRNILFYLIKESQMHPYPLSFRRKRRISAPFVESRKKCAVCLRETIKIIDDDTQNN